MHIALKETISERVIQVSTRQIRPKSYTENYRKIIRQKFLRAVLPEGCNLIKKETLAQVFSYEFCEISKNTFFTEHLWATLSEFTFFQYIDKIA